MTRSTIAAAVMLLAVGSFLAHAHAQTTGQTTPPPSTTQKPTTPAPPLPAVAAPTLPFPEGATIAYVQLQGVIGGSKFGRCGSQLLIDLRAKNQAALAPKQKEVQDLQAKIQSSQGVLSPAALTQMQRDLQRLQLEGQALAQQQQTDEENRNQDMLNDFQSKVLPVMEALRKEKSLTFILSADANAILAANAALDLTAEVVKRMDTAYPDCKKD